MGGEQEIERLGVQVTNRCLKYSQTTHTSGSLVLARTHPGASVFLRNVRSFLSQTRGILGQPEKEEVDGGRLIGTQWEP